MTLIVHGQVQGVGFRPFVWRLATESGLSGSVRNTSAGVRIEVSGAQDALSAFESRLLKELPPLAKITSLEKLSIKPDCSDKPFFIAPSEGHAGQNVLVSPDSAICDECLADIHDPANPRFGYPFTNCTNCGPRYTITKSIPYDRPATTMSCFPLCPHCAEEYSNPANRRFHAQPIACAVCGPTLWFVDSAMARSGDTSRRIDPDAISRAGRLILDGSILAFKGIGGFQLACDARNDRAVELLRKRKARPAKALAVMCSSLDSASKFCEITEESSKILTSAEAPVTLCRALATSQLSAKIAPDTAKIGVMLPTSPLHALLLDWLDTHGLPDPVLVMTSANRPGEPICLGNREALASLAGLADGWLLHDRDILVRVDDSVVDATKAASPTFIRRARGYVPAPVTLKDGSDRTVLGCGAGLKATFCLTRGDQAFVGQHIGDLESLPVLNFYKTALAHLEKLLEVSPRAVVHDLHPDLISTSFAKDLAKDLDIPIFQLQHHAAHAASVLAENGCFGPALALCLDGTGAGTDGSIWGGELIYMDLKKPVWNRLASLAPFHLPGGATAIREPWRIAEALNWQLGLPVLSSFPEKSASMVRAMLDRGFNCPKTSSCGRLFDAVAALLGFTDAVSYEGQAAMRLEKMAAMWPAGQKNSRQPQIQDLAAPLLDGQLPQLDTAEIYLTAYRHLSSGKPADWIAWNFHANLAASLARLCAIEAKKLGISELGLSGGCFQNAILRELIVRELRKHGIQPMFHQHLPPGDGGISFGQAVWGIRMLEAQKRSIC